MLRFLSLLAALVALALVLPAPESAPAYGQISVKTAAKPAPKVNLHPRSLEDIKKALDAISNAPAPKGDALDQERDAGLRRLKAYRYLAEVPYQNMVFDDQFTKLAQAAAGICEKIGKLDHKPTNPGLPDAEYQLALKGTSSSNLGQGCRNLAHSIDIYMDDSDPGNLPRLGHRRWCLNPTMMKTGFGKSGKFYAMYVFDRSQPKVPDFEMVCFPARGYMPIDYFKAHYAWSVSLNPAKFKMPDAKAVKPSVYAADEKGNKTGEALKLDFNQVSLEPRGMNNCIIFRPAKLDLAAGKCYIVEIEGVVGANLKGPLTYLVEFAALK